MRAQVQALRTYSRADGAWKQCTHGHTCLMFVYYGGDDVHDYVAQKLASLTASRCKTCKMCTTSITTGASRSTVCRGVACS